MSKVLRFALLALVLQPLPALAQPESQYGFPVTDTPPGDLPCYMVASNRNTLNLGRLCGNVQNSPVLDRPNVAGGRARSSSVRPNVNNSSPRGNFMGLDSSRRCQDPDDLDAMGNRCGNRAANQRPRDTRFDVQPFRMFGDPEPRSNSSSGSNNSSSNCQYSWQTDRNGNRCGGRAASERSGGN